MILTREVQGKARSLQFWQLIQAVLLQRVLRPHFEHHCFKGWAQHQGRWWSLLGTERRQDWPDRERATVQACGCPPSSHPRLPRFWPAPSGAGPTEVAAGTAPASSLAAGQAMKAAAASGCQTTSQSLWTEEPGFLQTTSELDKWPHVDRKRAFPWKPGRHLFSYDYINND